MVKLFLTACARQKGGYDIGDAKQVVDWLNGEDVDFVEISGGSYESAAMMGMSDDGRAQSTIDREMYFIDFAKDIAASAGHSPKASPSPLFSTVHQQMKNSAQTKRYKKWLETRES